MSNFRKSAVEIRDTSGSTLGYCLTVTDTVQQVPTVDDKVISEVLISNLSESSFEVSFDDGTTFFRVRPDSTLIWSPKGNIKHMLLKTSIGVTNIVDALINFEA